MTSAICNISLCSHQSLPASPIPVRISGNTQHNTAHISYLQKKTAVSNLGKISSRLFSEHMGSSVCVCVCMCMRARARVDNDEVSSLIIFICMFACVCVCVHMCAGLLGDRKRVSDFLEIELRAIVSY